MDNTDLWMVWGFIGIVIVIFIRRMWRRAHGIYDGTPAPAETNGASSGDGDDSSGASGGGH